MIRPDQNGRRHGDVSYISLTSPDPNRTEAFFTKLLGWGSSADDRAIPQIGFSDGRLTSGDRTRGPVLSFRVSDLAAAVDLVRGSGGSAVEPTKRGYALESLASDDQGTPFYLHQLHDAPDPQGPDRSCGERQGDVAYISIGVPDLALAERFYPGLLGWSFTPGHNADGRQIEGITPIGGMFRSERSTVILSYRVDDIADCARRVAELGGSTPEVQTRPYGLAIDRCVDDQGIEFGLLQLS